MFKVRETETGKVYTVYSASGLYFLIYMDDAWEFRPMDLFVPA